MDESKKKKDTKLGKNKVQGEKYQKKKKKKKNEKEILHWPCTHIIVAVFLIIFKYF